MLPEFWQKVSYFNPIVYLISAFRWSFYGQSDVNILISLIAIIVFWLCVYLSSLSFLALDIESNHKNLKNLLGVCKNSFKIDLFKFVHLQH